MSIWYALFWGAFVSMAFFVGQALAKPLAGRSQLTGQVMGFGAGAMISAIAYELIPLSVIDDKATIALAFLLGSIVYYLADRIVDKRGGANRKNLADEERGGSGASLFLGALLDGIPECLVLGIGIGIGGSISMAFAVAVFVANVPEGIAGTLNLKAAGVSSRQVFKLWSALTVACASAAAIGYAISESIPSQGVNASAFAAGAVLTMLADSMMPEAFEHGGKTVGLLTVFGFLFAAVLTVLE